MKLWDKGIETKELVIEFTAGQDSILDVQLAKDDVIASMAHVKMLKKVELLSTEECKNLLSSLLSIYYSIEKGEFKIEKGVEDIHSQVEILLTESLGDTGKKVHTARSRNDQVITDLKLFYRSKMLEIVIKVEELSSKLLSLSDKYKDIEIPGYTHMQVAMPSSFGLWFGAYAESLAEDLQCFSGAFRYVNQNPLGSAAGYGSSFPVDRLYTTELLEFGNIHVNSVNAQLSRGKTEKIFMSGISGIAGSLSKMAMDMILFLNQNFGFMKLKDEFTTGSSIMPHKKNPDILELIRAKANMIQMKEMEVFSIINNLTSGYHRDFQLLKEICFPAITDMLTILEIMSLVLDNTEVKTKNTEAKIYQYLGSVDAMNMKVMKGIPYRDAYRQVADEIADGSYDPASRVRHSHVGSMGNLQNDLIRDKLSAELQNFKIDVYGDFYDRFIKKIKKECDA